MDSTIDDILKTVGQSVTPFDAPVNLLTSESDFVFCQSVGSVPISVVFLCSMDTNRSSVWCWQVISNQLCIRYQKRGNNNSLKSSGQQPLLIAFCCRASRTTNLEYRISTKNMFHRKTSFSFFMIPKVSSQGTSPISELFANFSKNDRIRPCL